MALISITFLLIQTDLFSALAGSSAKIESIDIDRFVSGFCASLIKHVLRATLVPEDNGSSGSQLNKHAYFCAQYMLILDCRYKANKISGSSLTINITRCS